jgi:hypothetical protein
MDALVHFDPSMDVGSDDTNPIQKTFAAKNRLDAASKARTFHSRRSTHGARNETWHFRR